MRNEIRSQKLMQILQLASNPAMAPMVKFDYILREIASSLDLDEDKIVNDPREAAIQAMLMAQFQQNAHQTAQEGPQAPQQGQEGSPTPDNQAGVGAGAMGPGNAPEPGAEGFSRPDAVGPEAV
jgi:hypothetical protein